MAICYWNPNSASGAQVDTITLGGSPAVGNTASATINTKSITYTLTGTDTTATTATKLLALLQASTAPGEFKEIVWSVNGLVITATAKYPGTPFTLTAGATGGGVTVVHAAATANLSPSDVNNPNNWLRSGSPSLPQNGDDVVIQDSTIPLLWNLSALAAVTFNSYTRWQSAIGAIGLPENNPNGYIEYRPTYFQFAGAAPSFTMTLGQGRVGAGPGRERYNVGSQQTNLVVLATGQALDDYAVRFLGSNAANVLNVFASSVGVAMLPGETASVASAIVNNGASLSCGSGCSFSGQLTLDSSSATLFCAPGAVLAQNGSSLIVSAAGLTYAAVTEKSGSNVTWLSNSTITNLVLQTQSKFDKSGDPRPITITNSTQDGDTTRVFDPWNAITWTNAVTVSNAVNSGPITFGAGRTVKIT